MLPCIWMNREPHTYTSGGRGFIQIKTETRLSARIKVWSRWGLNCRTRIDPGAGLTTESRRFPRDAESIFCKYAENTDWRLKKFHRRKAEAVGR